MTLLQADTKSYKRFKTQIVDVVNGETLFMFQGHSSRDLAFGVATSRLWNTFNPRPLKCYDFTQYRDSATWWCDTADIDVFDLNILRFTNLIVKKRLLVLFKLSV